MNRWSGPPKCRDDRLPTADFESSTAAADAALLPHTRRPRRSCRVAENVSPLTSTLVYLVLLLCCFCSCVVAEASHNDMIVQETSSNDSIILFDHTTPPESQLLLYRRAELSTSPPSSSSLSGSGSSSSNTLPTAFDTALGSNFTTSTCPIFFKTFLSNSTFNACVPLSFLLQTSSSFFSVQRSPIRLAQTLGASCSVDFAVCSNMMASLARSIQSPETCGLDLQNQNPFVMQAYAGFTAYQSLYHAGCLLNSVTGGYCFSDAVTNATSPSDSYIYYLPLGVSFPVSSPSPSCSQCLRDTMAVFSSAASNSSQLISGVYAGAVTVVNAGCGKGFVHVPVASSATRVFGLVVDGGLRRCSAGFVLVVFSFVVAGFM